MVSTRSGKVREFGWSGKSQGILAWVRENGLGQGKKYGNRTKSGKSQGKLDICLRMPPNASVLFHFFQNLLGGIPQTPFIYCVVLCLQRSICIARFETLVLFCSLRWAILLILFNVISWFHPAPWEAFVVGFPDYYLSVKICYFQTSLSVIFESMRYFRGRTLMQEQFPTVITHN